MKKITIHFTVNHEPVTVEVEPNHRLIDVLRNNLGLTSVKEGCSEGECGACTVIYNGEPVTSCCILAGQADGSGQTLTALKTYADRLYVPLPQSEEEAQVCARAVEGMERPVCLGAADFLTEEEAQTLEDYGLEWGSLAETHTPEAS